MGTSIDGKNPTMATLKAEQVNKMFSQILDEVESVKEATARNSI